MIESSPQIRFEGFKNNWEKMKLSELVTIFGGYAFSSADSSSSGIPWLKIANIGKNKIDWNITSYLPDDFWEKHENYQLVAGDYVMALTRPILNHTLKVAVVDKKALLNQRVGKLIFNINSEYGLQLIQRRSVINSIENELAGTDPPNLGSKNLENINTSHTFCNEEQTKLGNFFTQLDYNISLQQHALDLLKQRKKAFLQKMFPKKGKNVPEIRFSGFNCEWKLSKLGHLASFSKGKGYKKDDLTSEGTPIILYGQLYTQYNTIVNTVNTYVTKTENSIISKGNEVIVPASGETAEDISRAAVIKEPGIIIGGDLNIIEPSSKINPVFLAITISSGKQKKELSRRAQGKSVVHIGNSNLKNVNLLFPTLSEQEKIGNFFKELDNSITLQEEKIESLKQIKKAFLQKMFV